LSVNLRREPDQGAEMARITNCIAAIALGLALLIATKLTVSAQGPAPVGPPAASANGINVTLHCGVGGISTNLFSTSGLRCPSPTTPDKCIYVIFEGWNPAGANGHDPRFDKLDFTCTTSGPDISGSYSGISADPERNVTYRTVDRTRVCVSKFPTVAGLIPENTELIVRGPFPCL
jgi:hypothetical protein